jgi:hypothetical protein
MSRFLSYIHNLRGAAIFFVVGVHARGTLTDWDSHVAEHNFIRTIFDAREGNGTVMFIFIAGFLFQYLSQKNFVFKKYIEQKFKYVIIPYLLISIPIIIYRIYTNFDPGAVSQGFNDQSAFYRFFYYLVTGAHMAPFWFISAIVLFYVTTPLLHALDRPWFYKYAFPLVFITCFFTYRSAFNANPLLSYLHYVPIYLLGMCTAYYKDKVLAAGDYLMYPLLAIYIVVSTLELTGYIPIIEKISFEQVLTQGIIYFNVYIFKAVILCFITMLLLYKFREKKMPLFEVLGEYSFGVFFVHFILIVVTKKLIYIIFGPYEFSLLTFTIYYGFVLLTSIGTVYFIKKLTGGYSRILIGS